MKSFAEGLLTAARRSLSGRRRRPLEIGQTFPEVSADSTRGPLRVRDLLARGPVVLACFYADQTPV